MKKLALTLCLGVALTSQAASPKLEIYRGEKDTVFSATHYVIAVTDPGCTATINGEDTHVYKTGSFGSKLTLKPGKNNIDVKVADGKKKAEKKFTVFYNPDGKPAAEEVLPEITRPLMHPLDITTLPGAYLQNGNGGDRLGGSKMGFVAEDIPMTAVGETDNLYKVQLSDTRYAYLPKEYAKEGGEGRSTVNSGSWSISNIGNADRVTVSLPRRVPYYYVTELDPSTLKVYLFGVTNNSNWITQRNEPGMIDYVDFAQDDSDVLTLIIRMKEKYQWGFTVGYQGNNIVIDVRHRPQSLALKDLTIGLDAGHGEKYLGAVSPSGITEKEVNLDIVKKIAAILEKEGAKVVLSRPGDDNVSMTERKRIFREAGVDLMVSVHNNSSGDPLGLMGTSVYYKHLSNRPLAKALHSSMLSLGVADFGLTGNFNFSLNGPTDYPNALVEGLFMSSLPEEEMLADPDFRTKMAEKVVEGIKNYLKEVEKSL
ncbi:MAG: N-acetylmuramoyl-L-alanine amidase [Bacteroidales bacterium]|nr:N-acetylmuramoyl-L-alanine amidase [Bacteroidales bacterium]MBD5246051.1 N-acetylmuramoyl-L-alanine amidase [Barnesiella sp.]